WMGADVFSGPGAPRADGTPPNEPAVVETNVKSAALSFVSRGRPVTDMRRTKLYSPFVAPGEASPAPSRKSVFGSPLKPTASMRVVTPMLARLADVNRANPAPSGMSVV